MKAYKLIPHLVIPIVTVSIGTFLASWLLIQYTKPQIKYYTDEYYQKVGEVSIGEVYLVNEGRAADEDVSVIIDEKIPSEQINISYLTSPYKIVNKDNQTQVLISQIKPKEEAEIVFQINGAKSEFKIVDVTSKSGNIRESEWIEPWWYLSRLQIAIVLLIAVVFFSIGFSVGLIKNDLIPGYARKYL